MTQPILRLHLHLLLLLLLFSCNCAWKNRRHQLYDSFLFAVHGDSVKGDVYLIKPHHGLRQLVPRSNDTLASFGFDRANLTVLSTSELEKFSLGEPVKPVLPLMSNCGNLCADDRLRVHIDKCWVIQPKPLLFNVRFIGSFINGPISILNDTCITVATKKPFKTMAHRSMMVAYELDSKCRDKADSRIYPTASSVPPNRFNFSREHFLTNSEDVRSFILPNNKLALVFTINRLVAIRPQYYLGYNELSLNSSTLALQTDVHHLLAYNAVNDRDHRSDKYFNPGKIFGYKNWSPFLYNNTIHFVQRLNPLHVTTMSTNAKVDQGDYVYMDTVSFSPHAIDWWKLGELRGGSPAHLINDHEYLTFFHSLTHLPNQGRGTYFMGAVTFSAHPPFRLLRISPSPIIDNDLYQGAWMRQRFDYVVYPMAFLFSHRDAKSNQTVYSNSYPAHIKDRNCSTSTDANSVTLVMSFGRQDDSTSLTDIPLCVLDSTLVDVGPSDSNYKSQEQLFW